jgi:predicted RNA-binding Zn-ribbon protein involved in translation (DUF1610 family)
MKEEQTCDHCGRGFERKRHDGRFCSPKCGRDWHLQERRRAIAAWREQQGYTLPEHQRLTDRVEVTPVVEDAPPTAELRRRA